jgi:hypothetical protein
MNKNEISFTPNPFDEDIDINRKISCKKLDKCLLNCFKIANDLILEDFIYEDKKDFRFELNNILLEMRDTHEMIREIYKKYRSNDESKVLCAIPLVRAQIESVYTIALLRRNFKEMIELFIISSWKKFYQKSFFELEERKNLPRFDQQTKYLKSLRNFIVAIGKKYSFDPNIENELTLIEEKIKKGKLYHFKKFPTPGKVVEKIFEIDEKDPILIVLTRLYINYGWLSSYTHGNSMSGYTRDAIKHSKMYLDLLIQKEKLFQKQIVYPNLVLDYLSVVIILTEICSFGNNPNKLRIALSEFWADFCDSSLLGKFVWENWAKKELSISEIKI